MKATYERSRELTVKNPPLTSIQLSENNISNLTQEDIIEDITFLITKSTNDAKDMEKSVELVKQYGISEQDYEEAKRGYKEMMSDIGVTIKSSFAPLHRFLLDKIKERDMYIGEISRKTGMDTDRLTEAIKREGIPNCTIANVALLYDLSKDPRQ